MSAIRTWWPAIFVTAILIALALVPFVGTSYHLALAIGMLNAVVLATAWALFSGPTRYISLATAAFFGIGAYAVAVVGEALPWPAVVAVAALTGIVIALIVGLSTLRLSGIYFVIFSFGLAELIRQLVTWYEVNVTRSVGRYIFLDISQTMIFWQLFALTLLLLAVGLLIARSRLGLALRAIGDDEIAAKHSGIDVARAKLLLFAVSAGFMAATGAIMAPRWTYIDPAIAFNPVISFQAVIMALLGGAGVLYGPLLGAVPLVLLFEVISANFPNYFSILLGVVFIVIVYFVPNGIAGLLPRAGAGPVAVIDAVPAMPPDLAPPNAQRTLAAGDTPLLVVSSMRKAFDGLVAVNDFSARIEHGALVGLIGPNGSGKTTALNLLSGALHPDTGTLALNGVAIAGIPPHRIARLGLGRTFQLVRVFDGLTCLDNVLTAIAWRRNHRWGKPARAEAMVLLEKVGLGASAATAAASLTYIDRKRLELARALGLRPELLLLDEWLAGLNPTELQDGIALINSLRSEGITIIMVEHVMDAIRSLCDRVIVMNAGSIIADGEPDAVLTNAEVVRAYLGDADA